MNPQKRLLSLLFKAIRDGGQDTPVAFFEAAINLMTEQQLTALEEQLLDQFDLNQD